jgi:L-fucose isomerase-like protein
MTKHDLDATALQCWNSIQENYGINACTIMSMMSEKMMPSACEVDITGVLAMYALQLASGTPSALVDWNNNYGDDPDKCVFFHCGNWAKAFLPEIHIKTAEILGTILGEENTYGAVAGRTPAGPVTFARLSTDDTGGRIRTYVGQGRFTDDPLQTFGARAVVEVPQLQKLMQYICRNGFEHHAAMNASHTGPVLAEAFETYLGWEVYHHGVA